MVYNGYFLDYFEAPRLTSYVNNIAFFMNMSNNFAAVPSSGDVPVVFTYTFDIGRFIAAAIGVPEWPQEAYIIGDELTFNELVKLAEEVKGNT